MAGPAYADLAALFGGNYFAVLTPTLTPASVATITTVEQDFAVSGLQADDVVIAVNPPGIQAGVSICAARVKSAGVLSLQFVNPTAGGVVPLAGVHRVAVLKGTRP